MEDFYHTDVIPGGITIISDEFNTITVDQNGNRRPLLPRTYNFFSQMAGENAQSRIYLGIHYHFDAIEGICTGDADRRLRLHLRPDAAARPPADLRCRRWTLHAQIRLSVLLENAAANDGLHLGRADFGPLIVADVFTDPSVVATLKNLFANPPPPHPSSLSSTSPGASGYRDAVFWWDFEDREIVHRRGRSASAFVGCVDPGRGRRETVVGPIKHS